MVNLKTAIAVFIFAAATLVFASDQYSHIRADGKLKNVVIRVEWDNPDVPKDRREKMKIAMNVTITANENGIVLEKAGRKANVSAEDYANLWKTLKKYKLFDLDSNVLTDPRPIGVDTRIFSIKIEGEGEKYFNVDVQNKRSKSHFAILDAIDALSLKLLGV